MSAGWRGWFANGLLYPRLRVRYRPKSVDFHDVKNRQRPCPNNLRATIAGLEHTQGKGDVNFKTFHPDKTANTSFGCLPINQVLREAITVKELLMEDPLPGRGAVEEFIDFARSIKVKPITEGVATGKCHVLARSRALIISEDGGGGKVLDSRKILKELILMRKANIRMDEYC
ncbi:hypothetical protein TNCV_4261221 [Trichonephila clavipes]|nr:hypothetical protein TNCV_4261221 [Trichonephila clavipes]